MRNNFRKERVEDMSVDFTNPEVKKYMLDGKFGLEKESLRVTAEGFLSHTPHPFPDNPNMERDFCENQTELITDVQDSVDAAWKQLKELHEKAVGTLLKQKSGPEYLWPFSNPPYVKGEEDIPIAVYQGKLKRKEEYRKYLAAKYGKKKMLFSGIHFNFSFSDEFLHESYKNAGCDSFQEYKNQIYLELAAKVTRYGWLIVYLTAASPVMDGSYFQDDELGKTVIKNYASPRCSEIGYWNSFIPALDYGNMDDYVGSIQSYIEKGCLREAAELYYPVRLKPAGENTLEHLKESGVNHIELRMLDLNPLSPVGVMKEDLVFIHLLLLYLLAQESSDFERFEQLMAIKNEKRAAKYEERDIWIETGWNQAVSVRDAALDVLFGMENFFEECGHPEMLEAIYFQEEKVLCGEKRYAVRIKKEFCRDYVKKGMLLAKEYAEKL